MRGIVTGATQLLHRDPARPAWRIIRPVFRTGVRGISLARAIAIQTAGAVFNAGVSFVLLALLARAFGEAGFGTYVALLSTAVLGLALIEGGWPARVQRETVDGSGDRALGLAAAHGLLATGALAAVAALLGGVPGALALACMGAVAACNLVSARLRGLGRYGYEAAWQAAVRVVSAAAILAVAWTWGASHAGVFASWLLACGVMLVVAGRHWLGWPRCTGLAGASGGTLAFLAIEGGLAFLLRGDMAVLGALGAAAEPLSDYAAGTRFVEAAVLVFAPIGNVLLRSLRLAGDEPDGFSRVLRQGLGLAALLGLGAMAASAVWGEAVMLLAFGPAFRDAGALLPWIAASLAPMLANLVWVQAAVARGRERPASIVLVSGAFLLAACLSIGWWLDAARGAALGALAAQSAICMALAAVVLKAPARGRPS